MYRNMSLTFWQLYLIHVLGLTLWKLLYVLVEPKGYVGVREQCSLGWTTRSAVLHPQLSRKGMVKTQDDELHPGRATQFPSVINCNDQTPSLRS